MTTVFAVGQPLTAEEQQYLAQAEKILDSLDWQQGKVELANGIASLTIPDSFYYLNAKDAEKMLVEVWGNPPGTGQDILGMLLPSNTSPINADSWGVTIKYEEDGYVTDDDADEIDYDALLVQMKEETTDSSQQRIQQGYESMELVGWASRPFYDSESHKLHWAMEIKFGDQALNTLNYNIRVLGRKGVLILNFIATMQQKKLIDSQINTVLEVAEFEPGSLYDDFDPSIDKIAAYGLGALIAGKVMAKAGLMALALVFLKKFWVLLVIGFSLLFRKIFKQKKE